MVETISGDCSKMMFTPKVSCCQGYASNQPYTGTANKLSTVRSEEDRGDILQIMDHLTASRHEGSSITPEATTEFPKGHFSLLLIEV